MSAEKLSAQKPNVVVFGTLNIDHVWSVARLPAPGQTVLAKETRRAFGGKGANQAVAAARQGACVAIVGAVGGDADGQRYREHLEREKVDTSTMLVHANAVTGAAHVYVDDAGENQIIVDGGANRLWDLAGLDGVLEPVLAGGGVLLAQLEAPIAAVKKALAVAATRGARTILNASPFTAEFRWDQPIDTVVVNEHECRDFFGVTARAARELSRDTRGQFLREHHINHLVVTQGAASTVHISEESIDDVPAYPVTPLDTVGAGDTFAGVLATRLGSGWKWADALWHANVAAALSTLSLGAQAAMPTREQVIAAADERDAVGKGD
ncbi:MAG: ribokinase [Magnetospirillum sp.]|nr:ribokinase [Magnetospirillum sp.]